MKIVKLITFAGLLVLTSTYASASNSAPSNGVEGCIDGACDNSINKLGSFARRGSPEANYILGTLHLYGLAVNQDLDKAKGYLKRASTAGISEADNLLQAITEKTISTGNYLDEVQDINLRNYLASYAKAIDKQGLYSSGFYNKVGKVCNNQKCKGDENDGRFDKPTQSTPSNSGFAPIVAARTH